MIKTSTPKKYYWLKLKEDFFDDETIRYIEEQPNGILYSNFYLKLCLKSLKYDGKLIRVVGETLIPYDAQTLSRLTGVDIDTVRCAMLLFEKIGTVKILESGEIYLSQVAELTGKETDKAILMRRARAEKKLANSEGVTMLPECYPEIEIRDRDKEKEKEDIGASSQKPSYNYSFFQAVYNEVCSNLPSCRTLTEKRKKAIRAFLKDFTANQWQEICQRSNGSKFLTGGNDRGWKADIDFLLKPDKAAKILEGGYSAGESVGSGSSRRELDEDELAAIARMMGE